MGCAYAHGASVVSKSTRATGDAGAVDLGIAYVVNSEAEGAAGGGSRHLAQYCRGIDGADLYTTSAL